MANLKYDETFPVKVAEYAAKGETDARIAARLGIALSTFYTYKEQFQEFAEGLLAGRRICYSRVRARLLQIARGQCTLTTKVFKNGELYKTSERNLPPNLKAIIYFQKHMRVGEIKPSAQTDSRISNLKAASENTPAQADFGISNFRSMGERVDESMGQQPIKSGPAQQDTGISKLGASPTDQLAVKLVPRSGNPTEPQQAPAQTDSGISKLK